MRAGEVDGEYASTVTDRLVLRTPEEADLQELFDLYADPQVWRHDPIARHTTIDQTARMIERWRAAWQRDGLGIWMARAAHSPSQGQLVGIGGCAVRYDVAWNLGYRLCPRFWRRGYAQEIIATAVRAARDLRPDLPVTAYLLEGNSPSQRATERAGLHLVWRGPDAGNPDPEAIRLLYADQDLAPALVRQLTDD